ncbi:MAG: extracellular solute-binding protein [Tyzzerella sp.]|nr:extracellular solute-binding protein [Tyzzerella sp.]
MMKKKLLAGLLALALACTGLAGCGSSNGGDSQGKTPDGKTELTLWSSYTAASNAKFEELVKKFNKENAEYSVSLETGQAASGNRQKLSTSTPEYYPSLFMGTNNAIYEYAEAEYVAPLQDFIDKDSEDFTEGMLESVKTSYSDTEGKLIGMPVGVSVKGYMVNLDVLAQTGYTVDDLTSFEKIAAAAQAAFDKGASEYGYIPGDGSEVLDMLLYQGVGIFDADNGHSGDITKSMYNEGETKAALTKMAKIYADMVKSGACMKNTKGQDAGTATFVNGRSLFWACTSSFVYELQDVNIEFEWAFLPFQGVDDNAKHKGSVLAEGTSIFIANTGDETEMQGAYEFLKFLAKPENQIFWSTFRGYTPYTEEALTSQEWITWRDENYPSEAKLEEKLKTVNAELKFPNATITNKLLDTSFEIVSNIISEPTGDVNTYIENAAEALNKSIEILQLRGQ